VTVRTLTSKEAIVRTLRELADYYEQDLIVGFSLDHSSPTGIARFTWLWALGCAPPLPGPKPAPEPEDDEDES
jgi:hypothetical protein